MRKYSFCNIIIFVLLCGTAALLYVHQEIEIFKTNFTINKHHHQLSFLLDQYRSLVYNLSRLESPKRIENSLSANEITLCMPRIEKKHRLERIDLAHGGEGAEPQTKPSFLASIFDRFSTKAEAKVVK